MRKTFYLNIYLLTEITKKSQQFKKNSEKLNEK